MKKIWVHKAKSFKEAEEFDRQYYLSMSHKERLDTMQYLRDIYLNFLPKRDKERILKNAYRKGLRGFIKVIQ